MQDFGLTSFDILFIVIVGLSMLFGLSRGFTAAVLSFAAWIAATVLTLYALPILRPMAGQWIETPTIADIIIIITIGFGSLFIFKLIANRIGDAIKSGMLGPLDRVLGALFGLLRGVLVVTLMFMMALWIIPRKSLPDWIILAKTRPIVEYGATIISSVTPAELVEKIRALDLKLDTDALDRDAINTVKDHLPERSETKNSTKTDKTDKGYRDSDREDLDRLIDTTK
ncbi:CvpA family protein [Govanella unica]|uniref:CvpA family protein n=1 Tax=Govanella unica TaxID=2975056 RepID=A0A9X3TYX3_9PROT|nr:CvpA family protein [Govania unica]MDA5194336.1 CvpA family protein [Govania unica]